jgi:hypothetical protein
MPVQIQAPNGEIVEFPDGTIDDVIVKAMRETYGGPSDDLSTASADTKALASDLSAMTQNPAKAIDDQRVADAKAKRDQYYSSGIYAGSYNPLAPIAKTIDAFASGAQRAPFFGWDDEAVAGLRSLAGNTPYATAQAQEDAKKQAIRQQNPIASTTGELAGGLATGGTIAATGATLAGRSIPYIGRAIPAAVEGAGYGAITGAGEAKPGERGYGAAKGAAVGAATGAIASKIGDALAASKALYDQAAQQGLVIKPQSADNMINNMQLAAGRINEKLRPKTAGLVDDIMASKGQPMSLERFHELRQEVNLALKNAEPQDERTLMRMKTILDGFADNATAADVSGNVQGFQLLKDANAVWAKKAKAQKIEDLFDLADVESAKYSQSGLHNAIKLKAKALYTRIVKGQEKGFSGEEVTLIRQLSKGEMTPKSVELLGKFAPRGIVSASGGSALGALIGSIFGPAGTAIGAATPAAIGFGAAKLADKAAAGGLTALRTAAATGNAPVLRAITNKTVPFIGGTASELSREITRTR